MKGIFLQQQLEFRLEASIPDEGCRQGDTLPCVLSVKNHGSAAQTPGSVRLLLARADIKKVNQKAADAYTVTAAAECAPMGEIGPQQQQSISWTFQIDRNAAISDKSQSLYLLYGGAEALNALGQLRVAVQPHAHIELVLRALETTFRFVLKGQKSSKGRVTAKLKPPVSPRFATLEDLTLCARFEDDAMVLDYLFGVKKIQGGGSSSTSLGVKKAKREFTQRLESGQYLLSGGFINHEVLDAAIGEALATVSTGL